MTAVDWDQDGLTDLLVGVHDLEGYWPDSEPAPARTAGRPQPASRPSLLRSRGAVARAALRRPTSSGFATSVAPASPASSSSPRSPANPVPLDIGLHPAPLAVCLGRPRQPRAAGLRPSRAAAGLPQFRRPASPRAHGAAHPASAEALRSCSTRTGSRSRPGDIDGDRRTELVYGTSSGHGLLRARRPVAERGPGADADPPPTARGAARRSCVDRRLRSRRRRGPGSRLWRCGRPAPLPAGPGLAATITAMPGRWRSRREERRSGSSLAPTGCCWGRPGTASASLVPAVADWLGHGRPDLIVTGAGGDVRAPAQRRRRDRPSVRAPRRDPLRGPSPDPPSAASSRPSRAGASPTRSISSPWTSRGSSAPIPRWTARRSAADPDRGSPRPADSPRRQLRPLGPVLDLGRPVDGPRAGRPPDRPAPRQSACRRRGHGDPPRVGRCPAHRAAAREPGAQHRRGTAPRDSATVGRSWPGRKDAAPRASGGSGQRLPDLLLGSDDGSLELDRSRRSPLVDWAYSRGRWR